MKDITQRQKFMIGVLIVMFIYMLYDYGVFSFGGDEQMAEKTTQMVPIVDDPNRKSIDLGRIATIKNSIRVFKLDYLGTWDLQDPFYYPSLDTVKTAVPGVEPEEEPKVVFNLSGISWDGNYGFALIGNDIIQENDIINGYLVEKIAADYVLLSNGEETLKLTLKD